MRRPIYLLTGIAAGLWFLGAGWSRAYEPFSGTWSPSCQPTEAKAVDNKLATIVFYGDAVKFSDFECEIAGWRKDGRRYRSDLTCFKKGEARVERRIAVRQVGPKLKVTISEKAFDKTVERCSN
jgi:hypothetical protein